MKMKWKIAKWLVPVIVAVILIALAFYYPLGSWDEGSPEFSIAFELVKVPENITAGLDVEQIEDRATVEIEINEDAIPAFFDPKITPMTVTEIGVPFLEPDENYILLMYVTVNNIPQSPEVVSMNTECTIFGQTRDGAMGDPIYIDGIGYYWFDTGQTNELHELKQHVEPNVPYEFVFDTSTSFYNFLASSPSGGQETFIKGKYIHDSTFNITIQTIDNNDPTIFGVTWVDIILKVGAGGTIEVQITDISAIASGT